ncbi:MAG: DUF4917 family protein [Lacipirellulaceae bacterium]
MEAAKKRATAQAAKPTEPDPLKLLTFDEALELSGDRGKRHLLLGNGFSIALRPDIFTYGTLLERASESGRLTKELRGVFDQFGTTDFEHVMEALRNAADLVDLYEPKAKTLSKRLRADAAAIGVVLAETIAQSHPERPNHVTDEQYASCKRFLANFEGKIYTLNYDLLLYWTLMQSEVKPDLASDDGFRDPPRGSAEYVVWEAQNSRTQNVFYLHGALHLFDAGHVLKKFTWSKTDVPLVDQIRESLANREYPLVVTEGTSDQKLDRIQHSNFLGRAYRSFGEIGGSLFIYGHSLAENDEHLLRLIDKQPTKKLFVGVYDDPSSPAAQRIIQRAERFPLGRTEKRPLEVHFFDASSAHVWDYQPPRKRSAK